MEWDDELERMALEVSELFGDDVMRGAMRRALARAHQKTRRSDMRPVPGALETALRQELQKLLRPH